jgi:hypothetical protein
MAQGIGGTVLMNEYDRGRAVRTKVIMDRDTGLPVIVTHQDTRAIIDDNRRIQNGVDRHELRRRHTRGSGGVQIASIPMVVYMRLRKLGITRDRAAMRKWLSDPANKYFRTDDGRKLI